MNLFTDMPLLKSSGGSTFRQSSGQYNCAEKHNAVSYEVPLTGGCSPYQYHIVNMETTIFFDKNFNTTNGSMIK